MKRRHLALLGDSVFDNAAYIDGDPDVAALLRSEFGDFCSVNLLAVDGSLTTDVIGQLPSLPEETTHLVVSAGGNDILHHVAMLDNSVGTVAEAVEKLASAREALKHDHALMIAAIAALGLPTGVCTIYDANYEPPLGRLVATAMSVFNDVITRNALSQNLDILDLRLRCIEPDDYANPIEPSVQGGGKIAQLIATFVRGADSRAPNSRVFI